MALPCNVGNTDRAIRIGVGIGIILAGVLLQSWWGLLGLVPVATGVLRFCPAYVPLKIVSK